MKSLLLLLILSVGLFSCKTSRNTEQEPVKTPKSLNGSWELNYISLEDDLFSFEELYRDEKPSFHFNLAESNFTGFTGCNTFSGPMKLNKNKNKISFKEPMTITEKHCESPGEEKFLEMLEKVDAYSISEDDVLALLSNNIAILRFTKK